MKKLLFMASLSLASFSFAADEVAVTKAQELMRVMKIDKQILGGLEGMLPMMRQQAIQYKLDAPAQAELKQIYSNWFLSDLDIAGMKKQTAALYANTFTVAEMDEVIKFYKSAVAKKIMIQTPELMKQISMITMKEAGAKKDLLHAKLKTFFAKHTK